MKDSDSEIDPENDIANSLKDSDWEIEDLEYDISFKDIEIENNINNNIANINNFSFIDFITKESISNKISNQ